MGIVYRVYDMQMGHQVALKTIQPRYAQNSVVISQFNREIKIMQRVGEHPHIVRVLDRGTLPNGLPYFTMSYIDGDDLKKIIFDAHRTLTLEEMNNFLNQIGSALAYAHGRDIKHRDIKPNNIIKARDGRFFLTDFGIAIGEGVDTGPQIHAWTEGYAAPEVLSGAASTPRSDVYSLGMTVVEVCLNVRYADAYRQTNGAPFTFLENKVFAPFIPILKKAIEPDPQRRYATIADFAGDFAEKKRWLEIPSTTPSRPPTLTRPVPDPNANRAKQAERLAFFFFLVVVAVLILALLAFFRVQSGA